MSEEKLNTTYSYVGYKKLPSSGCLVKFSNGTKQEDAYFQVSTDFLQENEMFFKQNDAHRSILLILKEYPLQLERLPAKYLQKQSKFFMDCLDVIDEYKSQIEEAKSSKIQGVCEVCEKVK